MVSSPELAGGVKLSLWSKPTHTLPSASGTVGGAVVVAEAEDRGRRPCYEEQSDANAGAWREGLTAAQESAFSFRVFAVQATIFPFRSGVALENPIADVSCLGLFQI